MEKEKENYLIAQSNTLTRSRQRFTVIEKRCLYGVIYEVRRTYVDNPNSEGIKTYQDMYVTFTADRLRKFGDEVKDVYAALKKLKNREIEINTDDEWVLTSWILKARHDKKTDTYTVLVSSEIIPCLVELAKDFTVYDLTVAIALNSTYSQRFYEICNQYKNRANHTFFLTVDEMRDMFGLQDKYKNGNMFKTRVLDTAVKELKELFDAGQCDIWFEYKPKDKEGRKIISYYFFIHTQNDKTNDVLDYQSVNTAVNRAMQIIKPFFPRDKKYVIRVMNAMQKRPEIAEEVTYKLEQKILDYDRASIPPIIRFVLKEDYGIE